MTREESVVRPGGVVVGFDGSRQATVALEWAAAEAARRTDRLSILLAAPMEYVGSPGSVGMSGSLVLRSQEGRAQERLAEAQLLAAKWLPEETIEVTLQHRRPALALLAAARDADLVVVGSRGHGAVRSVLLGSVSTAVAEHASCPVVVVRGAVEDPERPRAVSVGVDGSELDPPAVRFAAQLAASRGVPLRILCAWALTSLGHYLGYAYVTDTEVDEWARSAHEAAREAVTRAAEQARTAHHGLDVETATPQLDPGAALTEASSSSDVVVVGARGAGLLGRAFLGSVSRFVLQHAMCPVAVVRQ